MALPLNLKTPRKQNRNLVLVRWRAFYSSVTLACWRTTALKHCWSVVMFRNVFFLKSRTAVDGKNWSIQSRVDPVLYKVVSRVSSIKNITNGFSKTASWNTCMNVERKWAREVTGWISPAKSSSQKALARINLTVLLIEQSKTCCNKNCTCATRSQKTPVTT